MMKKPGVIIADNHKIVAEGIARLLELEYALLSVVEDGEDLIRATRKLHPEIVVTDITMPRLSGLDALVRIKKLAPPPRVVMLTMHNQPELAVTAFERGADAYLLKQDAGTELLRAIRETLSGRRYVTPLLANGVESLLRRFGEAPAKSSSELTSRQQQILTHVAQGLSIKEIAAQLHISPKTVEFHKYNVMKILNFRSTASLIRYALEHKLDQAGDGGYSRQ